MRKKIIIKGPALSQTGYGEQTRFALRCLRSRPDLFDIYLINLEWGASNHIVGESEERIWIVKTIRATLALLQSGQVESGHFKFDLSLQVTIPNEFEPMAAVNVGYTAGIETNKVSRQWIEQANNLMDRLIVISNHSRDIYKNTLYYHKDPSGVHNLGEIKLQKPCHTVNYSVKPRSNKDIDIEFPHDFNYLCISQWGPRKNFENTIKWFMEENYNNDVGLILKTNYRKNCTMDRAHTEGSIKQMLEPYKGRKCSVTLLHGYMTEEEMQSLYEHKQVKAFVNIAHGEGFGLPLFDAAAAALPIITIGWSGHCDFLYKDEEALFLPVKHALLPVDASAVWPGVIEKEAEWAYADQSSFKMALREMRKNYDTYKEKATTLSRWVKETFTEENQYNQFVKHCWGSEPPTKEDSRAWETDIVVYE